MITQFTHIIISEYQMFFIQAGSCQMEGITALYNYIMSFLTGILCVVTTALVIIIFVHLDGQRHINQFKNEKNLELLINWMKYLQKWTHSTMLELVWTIIPTIILIAIAIPSFILLYSLDEIVDTQAVIKIIGYQWYWKYEYPVYNPYLEKVEYFSYLSYMTPIEDLNEENNLRLLSVDMPLILPTNVNVKLIITAKDVIHSFAVPALGIKMDAVPGRLNQVTVHIYKPGIYYGQCSELCGVNHAFMPIEVYAIDFNSFERFLLTAIKQDYDEYIKDELIPLSFYEELANIAGYYFEQKNIEKKKLEELQETLAKIENALKAYEASGDGDDKDPSKAKIKDENITVTVTDEYQAKIELEEQKITIDHIPKERLLEYLIVIESFFTERLELKKLKLIKLQEELELHKQLQEIILLIEQEQEKTLTLKPADFMDYKKHKNSERYQQLPELIEKISKKIHRLELIQKNDRLGIENLKAEIRQLALDKKEDDK